MCKFLCFVSSLIFGAVFAFSAQDATGAVEGTVKKIDAASKTIVVKTADGTERKFHFADRAAVHGVKETAKGSGETLHGLKEGSDVVVHYTSKDTTRTAEEIDRVGKDGLKIGEGTIQKIDRSGKTLIVKSAGGAEETYRMSDRAAVDAGRDLGKGGEKSEKATVYYTEEAGQKVAHYFKKAL